MGKKPTFKQQLNKIAGAYQRKDICPVHIEHHFLSALLNGHTAWTLAVAVEPGPVEEPKLNGNERSGEGNLKDILGVIFETMNEMRNKHQQHELLTNPLHIEFWANGGQVLIDHKDEDYAYIGQLTASVESNGLYNVEDLVDLAGTFWRSYADNADLYAKQMSAQIKESQKFPELEVIHQAQEEILHKAVHSTLVRLAFIHAREGEDVLAWDFKKRVLVED